MEAPDPNQPLSPDASDGEMVGKEDGFGHLSPDDVTLTIGETEEGTRAVEVFVEVPDALHETVQREVAYSRSVNGYADPQDHYLLDRLPVIPRYTVDGERLDEW